MNARGGWWVCLFATAILGCAEGPKPVSHSAPRVLFKPSPVYPEGAYMNRLKGRAEVSLVVDTLGVSREVRVLGEDPEGMGFGEAAAQAVQGWIWEPAKMGGAPVDMGWNVTLLFDPSRSERVPALATLLEKGECAAPPGLMPDQEGGVLLFVRVASDGTPEAITVLRESPEGAGLGRAAKACVASWRWSQGVPSQTYVAVGFPSEPAR